MRGLRLVPLGERAQEVLPLRLVGAPLRLRGARRDVGAAQLKETSPSAKKLKSPQRKPNLLVWEGTDVLHVPAHHALERAELLAGDLEVVDVPVGPIVLAPPVADPKSATRYGSIGVEELALGLGGGDDGGDPACVLVQLVLAVRGKGREGEELLGDVSEGTVEDELVAVDLLQVSGGAGACGDGGEGAQDGCLGLGERGLVVEEGLRVPAGEDDVRGLRLEPRSDVRTTAYHQGPAHACQGGSL